MPTIRQFAKPDTTTPKMRQDLSASGLIQWGKGELYLMFVC